MTTTVTFSGVSFADTDFSGYGYNEPVTVNGTAYPRFQALLVAAMADFARAIATTSASSVSVGTGTKSFTLAEVVPVQVGQFATMASAADPTGTFMHGQVTAWNSSTRALEMNVTYAVGSGSASDWRLSIAGPRGATGASTGVDINGLAATTSLQNADEFVIYDASETENRKFTAASLRAQAWLLKKAFF